MRTAILISKRCSVYQPTVKDAAWCIDEGRSRVADPSLAPS